MVKQLSHLNTLADLVCYMDIDLSTDGWVSVNDILIEEGHAYDYHGGKKKDFKKEIKEEKEKAKKSIKEV